MNEAIAVVRSIVNQDDDVTAKKLWYLCPACEGLHAITIEGPEPRWSWNGSLDAPTLSPSVLSYLPKDGGGRETLCHHFLTDGKVVVCGDSPKHPNETLPLPPLPAWLCETPHVDGP